MLGKLTLACVLLIGCTSEPRRSAPVPPPTSKPGPSKTAPSVTPSPTPKPLADPALQKYCRPGDPLVGVYSPARLAVKNPCVSVTGVIRVRHTESDGDIHLGLAGVDHRWLNAANLGHSLGDLVLEIVPDLPMAVPPIGSRVTVIGPWVLDTQTGWNEIHPVWRIILLG
jgi:hypothetical protein